MQYNNIDKYVIGVDFGTDSCRAIIVNACTGVEVAQTVSHYTRWDGGNKNALYCDASKCQYRQHPLDYIESMENAVTNLVKGVSQGVRSCIKGLSFDTTSSTPVLTDINGTPLALSPEFQDNPNAMFILWKDHSAIKEADEINKLARISPIDYTSYSGGIYSSEWVWAKVLHVVREDNDIQRKAYSWVEHCDWITGLVVGNTNPYLMKRSRCAAAHKAMWHESWGGLPSEEFLSQLDPSLARFRRSINEQTYTGDNKAGNLSKEWAEKFGLSTEVSVSVGLVDAHAGAVGAGIEPYTLTRIIGTSTCDILIASKEEIGDMLIPGICGQADGSVIPGYIGLEAGQSAFGDIYAWYKNTLLWPAERIIAKTKHLDKNQKELLVNSFNESIIAELSEAAVSLTPGAGSLIALDWLNGRRSPDADFSVQGAIIGMNLSTTAPMIFRALVEATAFGSKAIVDHFINSGIAIKSVLAIGGIPLKSPLVMQIMADVLNVTIKVTKSDQTCALGAAMFAAVASGICEDVEKAQKAMTQEYLTEYIPNTKNVAVYDSLYKEYQRLGSFINDRSEL
ncbi:MAG: ribulokinase [Bacteroidales bacterium]|jgi:L-ribulokinase